MRNVKLWIFIGIVILVVALNHVFGWSDMLLDDGMMDRLSQMMNDQPVLAALIYCVISFVGSVILALPGVLFAISAGLLFGPVEGTLLCWISMSFGAALSFLVGRFFLQDSIKPKLEKSPALNKLLFEGADKSDIYLLAITRLVPVFPFNLQNFAYGITDIKFVRYTVFSALFILPGTAVYTIASAGVANEEMRVICIVVAVILLAITLLVARFLKKKADIK